MSAPFISNLFNNKRAVPKDRLEDISRVLELEVLEREALVKAVHFDLFSEQIIGRDAAERGESLKPRKSAAKLDKTFLSDWRYIAVLEGLTLAPQLNDPESLRARLGLTVAKFNEAIAVLMDGGMIEERAGEFVKTDEHLYLAAGRSKKEIRTFHDQMITRAKLELAVKTTDDEYQRRLINGFTIALNPEMLEKLKAKIIKFMDELAQEASRGDCAEVYQCNVQFFPLTKKN